MKRKDSKSRNSITSIEKDLYIKVPIKQELKKLLIFGLQARLPIAMILSFIGLSYEVYGLMQTLSHRTRAFIFNA